MPHYYFDIKNGHRMVDAVGLTCTNDADAIFRARAIAVKIWHDTPSPDPKRHIAVLNSQGDEVMRVPITNHDA